VSKESGQYVAQFLTSSGNLISNIGTLDSNYYARPIDDTDVFWVRPNGWSTPEYYYTLAEWQSYSSQDANSVGSPIAINSVDSLVFYYNYSANAVNQDLDAPVIGFDETKYASSVAIPAYSSFVGLLDPNPNPSQYTRTYNKYNGKWLMLNGKRVVQ
jgi:hypothetical protein